MYRGFNLDIANGNYSDYYKNGKEIHEENKIQVKKKLDSFKNNRGILIASEIIDGWFPPVNAHIFLSHSHKDEKQVIGLAGWLYKELGLKSFIDSCIWGSSSDLLKLIDDEYCYNESTNNYNYQKRNRSTSHVHMMLSTALTKMINNCECVIFVNTPNAISPKEYIEGLVTDSPWIYAEIAMTSLVQKRPPYEHRGHKVALAKALESMTESLPIEYKVDLMHLIPLSIDDLDKWNINNKKFGAEALDVLYKLKGERRG